MTKYVHNQVTIREIFDNIFLLKDAEYLNMYLGIFLLSPFLNIIWNNLETYANRTFLVLILVLISSLCTVTKNYTTSYWQSIFPIMYYFIGCHLGTYTIHGEKYKKTLLLFMIALLQAVRIFFECKGEIFNWGTFGGYCCSYNALPTVMMVYLLFSISEDIEIKSVKIKNLLQNISRVSLEIFLVALMFGDNIVHVIFAGKITSTRGYFVWVIPYTIIDVALSFVIARVVAFVVKNIFLLVDRFSFRNKTNMTR